jgi:Aldo/keto reductase family
MQNTQLTTTQLGRTGLEITRVGFGAWAIGGGGWEFGWGAQHDADSIAAIHHALEQGINWIDTAAAYGFGRSERVVGRALEAIPQHARPYVFTKASLLEAPSTPPKQRPVRGRVGDVMSRSGTGMPFLDAQADFRAARRAHALARIGRWLTRQPNGGRAPTLTDPAAAPEGPAHLEIVPLERIVGTLEPTRHFDAHFRPASELVRPRWERIALAHHKGIPLPPIALQACADRYYVIDGRHRVSVAHALHRLDIDAWVVGALGDLPARSQARPIAAHEPPRCAIN